MLSAPGAASSEPERPPRTDHVTGLPSRSRTLCSSLPLCRARAPQATLPAHVTPPVLQGFAAGCEVVQSGRVEERGLEPQAFPCGYRPITGQGGSESGSVVAPDVTLEAELAWVMSAWGGLSSDTRTAILAIVEAAQGR